MLALRTDRLYPAGYTPGTPGRDRFLGRRQAIVRPGGLSQLEIPRPSILYRSAPADCATGYTGYPTFSWTFLNSLLFEAYESNGGSSGGCPVARIRDKWRNVRRTLGFWHVRSLIAFINENFQFSPKAVTTLLSAWDDIVRLWTVYPTLRTLQHYLQLYNVQVSYFTYSSLERRGFSFQALALYEARYSVCHLLLRPQFVPHRECSPFLAWRPVKCMYLGF